MITIKKNNKCDTRTCDVNEVSEEVLLENSKEHIKDVRKGMLFLSNLIRLQGDDHDHTKISGISQFYDDFKNKFSEGHTSWWEIHQKTERHHLKNEQFIQDDVNLIDILEQITDGVMAGLARSGEYRQEQISPELLKRAYDNTVKLLLSNVTVEK